MPLWRRVLLGLALGVAAGYAVAALRPRRGTPDSAGYDDPPAGEMPVGAGNDDTRPGTAPDGDGPGEG